MMDHDSNKIYSTTILCIKKDDKTVMIGDGQVSFGHTILKGTAKKVRRLYNNQVLAGFAGATADAFTLSERLEAKLETYHGQLTRACVELAKDWRMDKYLRRLEAMMIVADKQSLFVLTGNGDVIEPENNIAAIGSGGLYALSAAKAIYDINGYNAEKIGKKAMQIASEICVYTNSNFVVESL